MARSKSLLMSLIGSVVLLGWCFIVDVSSQDITLVSSLQATNRTYVCPDEIATYVCRGGGNVINLYAPPYISSSNPISYVLGDTLGNGFGEGPILTNLISTAESIMISNILVQNSSLPEFSVHCAVRSPFQEIETQHRPSERPLDVSSQEIVDNPENGTVQVTWMQESGNYDLSYYTVQLLENNTEIQSTVVSAESNSQMAVFSVPFNVNVPFNVKVRARITVTSKCVQTSTGVFTNTTIVIRPQDLTADNTYTTEYVFLGFLSAATFILAIVVFVLGVCLCKKC